MKPIRERLPWLVMRRLCLFSLPASYTFPLPVVGTQTLYRGLRKVGDTI